MGRASHRYGNDTDPYQRCEGKYHLTKGIIKVLAEARNPFSILTKSTLIIRDLDLLAAAAQRTSVRVNLSIGTLDELRRSDRTGHPSPPPQGGGGPQTQRRGIPCGVLVAPVLPSLSDDAEQLREVIEAVVDAGAVSVSSVGLHLKPGLRAHFLDWLTANRPDLVPEYERRFARSYQPKKDRDALANGEASGQPGTRFGVSPALIRSIDVGEPVSPSTRPKAPPPEPAQLSLL